MKAFKIDGHIYEYIEGNCQLSIGSHATLYYSFDTNNHKEYKNYFLNKYEIGTIFDIVSSKYIAKSSIIKSVDMDNSKNILNLSIRCDILQSLDTKERREDILGELLNSTFVEEPTKTNSN